MGSLPTYVVVAVAVITAIGVAFHWINQFVADSDKERLKRKFEDFWLSVAELSTTGSVGRAIKSRYGYMKRSNYACGAIKSLHADLHIC
jgi:hypothetical protein